jgi:hypothetical protein
MSNETQHLSQDDLVLAYYGEPGIGAQREHLAACADCRAELERLAGILDRVTPAEVPEPDEDYEARVWDRMTWRLRGERRTKRSSGMKWLAAAAMLAVAFLGGLLWNRSNTGPVRIANQPIATTATAPAGQVTAASTQQQRDRILLVVVGDHLDDSERMLLELTNLSAKTDVDVSTERQRAEELLASNRLYRRTAIDRGEDRVATLLDELEPVLMQIAHGPSQMTPDELQRVQKRVETKGLVFKLRVLRADVRATAVPHLQQQPNI